MERVFLDANILLELLFNRARREHVIAVLSAMPDATFCLSVLSLDLVMYFVEAERASKALAQQFLRQYELIDMTRLDAEWAFDNDAGDFEDALQVAVARRVGARHFVTLDKGVAGMYGSFVPVLTIR